MKAWHLGAVLTLAILSGWQLNRQQPAKAAAKVGHETIAAHLRVLSPEVVARAPAQAKHDEVIQIPRNIAEFRIELKRINMCYAGDCNYPKTDARSYELAVGQDLKKMLFQMAEWVRSEGIAHPEISEIARRYVSSEDGFVQAAALDLLSTQGPNGDNLEAILTNVVAGYDSELIEHAMLELERYTSRTDLDKIDQALAQTLTTCAPFVAREVSTHIAPFVNERSYMFFQDVVAHLPLNSASRANLETSLAEYQHR